MILSLLLGCNNGISEQLAAEKRLGEIGRSAENTFYSFIDLIAGKLGFTVKVDTTKDKVGKYFSGLGEKLGKASEELEKLAKKAETDIDKSDSSKNLIKEAVDTAKGVLATLKGHLDSLGKVGDTEVVGYAHNALGQGAKPEESQLKEVFDSLKGIVEIAGKEGVEALKAGATTLQASGGADNKDGAKILSTSTSNPGNQDAGKAAAILASVSGDEMLAEIVNSKESDPELSGNAEATTSAISFAKGGQATHLAFANTPKAAAVAVGIALRSLVKAG